MKHEQEGSGVIHSLEPVGQKASIIRCVWILPLSPCNSSSLLSLRYNAVR